MLHVPSEPAMLVNRTDLADLFGVAKTTVDAWLRDGCPCRGGGGRGVERKFDTAEVHHLLIKRALAEPDLKAPTLPDGSLSLHEALRRKEVTGASIPQL